MKKIFKFLVLIIMLISAFGISGRMYGQDLEPTQHTFSFGNNTYSKYIEKTDDYFKIENFVLGWHWGVSREMKPGLCMLSICSI
jgi:hypothetical protein